MHERVIRVAPREVQECLELHFVDNRDSNVAESSSDRHVQPVIGHLSLDPLKRITKPQHLFNKRVSGHVIFCAQGAIFVDYAVYFEL